MSKKTPSIEELRAEYTEVFNREFGKEPRRGEILEAGKRNAEGKLYILGGYAYGSIIRGIYGTQPKGGIVDVDFVSQALSRVPYVPRGWKSRRTSFDNPCLETEGYKIDLNSLRNFRDLGISGIEPTIENLLKSVPMDIQAIAWDCETESLVQEERGMAVLAIYDKEIWVNNHGKLAEMAEHRGTSAKSVLVDKAREFGFRPVFSYNKKSYIKNSNGNGSNGGGSFASVGLSV